MTTDAIKWLARAISTSNAESVTMSEGELLEEVETYGLRTMIELSGKHVRLTIALDRKGAILSSGIVGPKTTRDAAAAATELLRLVEDAEEVWALVKEASEYELAG